MKSYNVKYTKGHLIDSTTEKRVILKRGGTFNILGDDDQFELVDELELKKNPLGSLAKLSDLQKQFPSQVLEKIADSGHKFVYRIGLSKLTSEENAAEFLFEATIQEDLYLMSKNKKDWRLCECLCKTEDCIDGDIQMLEPIWGTSLNNLFSNIVAFYFPLQRSGACNVFKTFHHMDKKSHRILDVKNNSLKPIEYDRRLVIEKYNP